VSGSTFKRFLKALAADTTGYENDVKDKSVLVFTSAKKLTCKKLNTLHNKT
jgi:hypothetical protein